MGEKQKYKYQSISQDDGEDQSDYSRPHRRTSNNQNKNSRKQESIRQQQLQQKQTNTPDIPMGDKFKNIFGMEKIGNFGAFMVLFSKICAIGVVVLPYAMRSSGIVSVSILIVIIGGAFSYTTYLFLDVINRKNIKSPDLYLIIKKSSNKFMANLSSIIFFIVQIGICTIYMLLVAEYIRSAICSWTSDDDEIIDGEGQQDAFLQIRQQDGENQLQKFVQMHNRYNPVKNKIQGFNLFEIVPFAKLCTIYLQNIVNFNFKNPQLSQQNRSQNNLKNQKFVQLNQNATEQEQSQREQRQQQLKKYQKQGCTNRATSIFLAMIPIICFSFLREVKIYQIFHYISGIVVQLALFIFMIYIWSSSSEDGDGEYRDHVYDVDFFNIPRDFGIILFALMGHTYFFQLRFAMKEPEKLVWINTGITVFSLFFYIVFAIFCVLQFGYKTQEIGIFSIDFEDGWMAGVPFLFAIGILIGYPVQLLPLLKQFEQTFFYYDEDVLLIYEKTDAERKQDELKREIKIKQKKLKLEAQSYKKQMMGDSFHYQNEDEQMEIIEKDIENDFFFKNLIVRVCIVFVIAGFAFFFADFSCLVSLVGNIGGYAFGFLFPVVVNVMSGGSRPQIVINIIILGFASLVCFFGILEAIMGTLDSWTDGTVYTEDRFLFIQQQQQQYNQSNGNIVLK